MTLSEIIYLAGEIGNPSIRQQSNWVSFVNQAVQEIAQRKNWTFLHDRRQYEILSGDHSVSLGAQFKCLSGEESPISVTYSSGGVAYNLPVCVITREQVEQFTYWPWMNQFLSQPVPGGYVPIRVVFLERDGTGFWRLHIPPQFTVVAGSPYNVSAFYYPDPLKLGTDSNAITNHPDLVQGVINLAAARSFFSEDKGSQQGLGAMQLYNDSLNSASYSDSEIKYAGRVLRM